MSSTKSDAPTQNSAAKCSRYACHKLCAQDPCDPALKRERTRNHSRPQNPGSPPEIQMSDAQQRQMRAKAVETAQKISREATVPPEVNRDTPLCTRHSQQQRTQ
jgi:hypothetical protein